MNAHGDILRNQKGVALVVALLAIMLVSVLVASMAFLAKSDILFSTGHKESKQALDIAEAGLAKAIWYLENADQIASATSTTVTQVPGLPTGYSAWNWQIWRPGATFNTASATAVAINERYKETFQDGEFEIKIETISGISYTIQNNTLNCATTDCINNHVVRISSKGTVGHASRTVSRMINLSPVMEELGLFGLGRIDVIGTTANTLLAPFQPGKHIVENGIRKQNKGAGMGSNGVIDFNNASIKLNDPTAAVTVAGTNYNLYDLYFGPVGNRAIPGDLVKAGSSAAITALGGGTDYTNITDLKAVCKDLYMSSIKRIPDPVSPPEYNWGLSLSDVDPTPERTNANFQTSWYNQATAVNIYFVANKAVPQVGGTLIPVDNIPQSWYLPPFNGATAEPAPGGPAYNMLATGYTNQPLLTKVVLSGGQLVPNVYLLDVHDVRNETKLVNGVSQTYQVAELMVRDGANGNLIRDMTGLPGSANPRLEQQVTYNINPGGGGTDQEGATPTASPYNSGPGNIYNHANMPISNIIVPTSATTDIAGTYEVYVWKSGGNSDSPKRSYEVLHNPGTGWTSIATGQFTSYIPVQTISLGGIYQGIDLTLGDILSSSNNTAWKDSSSSNKFRNCFKISSAPTQSYPPRGDIISGITLYFPNDLSETSGSRQAAFKITGDLFPMFENQPNTATTPIAAVTDYGAFSSVTPASGSVTLSKDMEYTGRVVGSGANAVIYVKPSGQAELGPFNAPAGSVVSDAILNFDLGMAPTVNDDARFTLKTGNPVKTLIVDSSYNPTDTFTFKISDTDPNRATVYRDSTGAAVSSLSNFTITQGQTVEIETGLQIVLGSIFTKGAVANIGVRGVAYDTFTTPGSTVKRPNPYAPAYSSSIEEVLNRFDNFKANMLAFGRDANGIPKHRYGNFYVASNEFATPASLEDLSMGPLANLRPFHDILEYLEHNAGMNVILHGYNYVWLPKNNDEFEIERETGGGRLTIHNGALIVDGAVKTENNSEWVIQHPKLSYTDPDRLTFTPALSSLTGPEFISYMPGLMIRKSYIHANTERSINFGTQSRVHIDGMVYTKRGGIIGQNGSLFVTGAILAESEFTQGSYTKPAWTNENGTLILRYDKIHTKATSGMLGFTKLPPAVASPLAESWLEKVKGLF